MKSFFKFFLTVCILFANSQSIFGAVSLQEFIKKIPEDYEISLTLDQRNNLNGVDLTSEVFYNQNRDNIQSQKSWKVALIRKRRIKYYDNYLTWFAGNASAEASGAAGGGGAITHPKDSRLVRKSSLFDYLEPKSSTADGPLSSTAAGSMAFGVDNEEPRDLPTPMSFKEEEKSSIPAGSKRARSDKDLPDYGDMYSEELPAASAAAATGSALVPFGIPKSDKESSSSESDIDENSDDQADDREMEYEELDNNYEEDEYDEEGQVVPVGLNDLYPASSSSSSSAARKKQDIMNMPCPEGLDSAFWNGINLTLDLYNSKPRTESFDRWSKKIIRERRSRYLRSPERRHHDRRLARERGRKYAQRQKEKSKIKKYDDEE